MIKVGITGQAGFVGTNLYNYLNTQPEFKTIPFEDQYYDDSQVLEQFTRECDVIVHLAAIMRSQEKGVVYQTNMRLVRELINAADNTGSKPFILFASSIMENDDNEYGQCKREGTVLFQEWCKKNGSGFCKMIFPNLFGPYAKPNYSSFIATFCYKLTHGEQPQVLVDKEVPLVFIGDMVQMIAREIVNTYEGHQIYTKQFEPQFKMKVTEVLAILETLKDSYLIKGIHPSLQSKAEEDLFTTFKSYIDYQS